MPELQRDEPRGLWAWIMLALGTIAVVAAVTAFALLDHGQPQFDDVRTYELLAGAGGAVALAVGARTILGLRADRRVTRALPGQGFGPPRAVSFQGTAGGGPAWDEPAVRKAWWSHLRRARDQVAIGAVLAAIMTFAFVQVDQDDDAFLRDGAETMATVTGGDYGSRRTPESIALDYTVDGTLYQRKLTYESPDDHPEGSRLPVIYDPQNPRDFRTRSNSNHSALLDFALFVPSFVAGLLLFSGLFAGYSTMRWRRWLRRHAARRVRVTEGAMPRWFGEDAWVLRITAAAPYLKVATRLAGPRRWLDKAPAWIGGAPGSFEGTALVCAGTGRRLVVFDPDVAVPVEVILPMTAGTAKKWLDCS